MTEKKKLGLALCGSYCTYDKVFAAAEKLRAKYDLVPLMSETAAGPGRMRAYSRASARRQ